MICYVEQKADYWQVVQKKGEVNMIVMMEFGYIYFMP